MKNQKSKMKIKNEKSKRKKYEQIMCLYTLVLYSAIELPFRKIRFSSCLIFYNFILAFPFPLVGTRENALKEGGRTP